MFFGAAHDNRTEENIRIARLQRNRVNRLIESVKETYIKEPETRSNELGMSIKIMITYFKSIHLRK